MRLLLLGGTAFVGRAAAAAARDEGMDVTCVARGRSGDFVDGVTAVRADRNDEHWPDLLPAGAHYDAIVDLTRQPGQVRNVARRLLSVADHYIFISSISVYADTATSGLDESAALVEPLAADEFTDMSDYGAAKVACAQAVLTTFGPMRTTLIRPGLIGGHGDTSGRSGYWPWRFANPSNPQGQVVVPADLDAPAQLIDVDDLADFVVRRAQTPEGGIYNVTGEHTTVGEVLRTAQAVAGGSSMMVPVDAATLHRHGVRGWAGPQSLPLWIDEPDFAGMRDRSNAAAINAGLTFRPADQTLAQALRYEQERPADVPRAAGLSDELERTILSSL